MVRVVFRFAGRERKAINLIDYKTMRMRRMPSWGWG
jgi:hypothetical protein